MAMVKEGSQREELLTLGDSLKSNKKDYAIILIGGSEGKMPITVFLGGKALDKAKAGDVLKKISVVLGGSGGGRPDMASGQVKTKKALRRPLKKSKISFKEILC